ncbi:hypothetical protein DV711_12705 [Motiliproteus coralliicola]|uniref:Uncharacterized protein n=1 Tax=Motiliproteus coralliicola TaxID=2283196 RepID=A0A369WEL1_9GAMM|nr:hypothetical protein DV711_12705 [Motiliproteus coralliicola]
MESRGSLPDEVILKTKCNPRRLCYSRADQSQKIKKELAMLYIDSDSVDAEMVDEMDQHTH